ncbi:MAG: hypothetical protein J4F36_05795 [Nitrosopumilaceae archaeon]|nr:hypothetical protein [Nitrosopumilaceae archaeon]
MKYSHKVTFSIFAILFFGTASLAYAAGGDFIFDFDGTDGGGTAFDNPTAITVDSDDRIIVADNGLDLVQIFEGFATSGSGGNSDASHKARPTFGLDPNTFKQLIEGGFSFNGVSHDITDNFWTPFPEQEVKVGTMNSFTSKVFAGKQLRVQEFLFGIPDVGDAHKAELGIEVHYDFAGNITAIKVVQETNVIDVDSVTVETINSKCLSSDEDERCITTHLSMNS